MRFAAISICLFCLLSITSCRTKMPIVDIKSKPCNLPFVKMAAREFSYPTIEACGKAAADSFNVVPSDHPYEADFFKTKLTDSLYMWRRADNAEVRFVVRPSNSIPQAINYWEIEKSIGDDSQKLKDKIIKVIKKLIDPAGCNCKVIRKLEETPDRELPKGKTKAWRAVVECSKKASTPAMGVLQDAKEVEVSGIVINPTYP